jgi:hypothetical protein
LSCRQARPRSNGRKPHGLAFFAHMVIYRSGQMRTRGQKATRTIRTALITFHQLAILPD